MFCENQTSNVAAESSCTIEQYLRIELGLVNGDAVGNIFETKQIEKTYVAMEEMSTCAVVVVKWTACLPSILTIWVWILLTPTVFSVNLCLKRTKINKNRSGLAHSKIASLWIAPKRPLKDIFSGHTQPFLIYFGSFQTNKTILQQIIAKMSIEYLDLGIKPTTSWKQVFSHNH